MIRRATAQLGQPGQGSALGSSADPSASGCWVGKNLRPSFRRRHCCQRWAGKGFARFCAAGGSGRSWPCSAAFIVGGILVCDAAAPQLNGLDSRARGGRFRLFAVHQFILQCFSFIGLRNGSSRAALVECKKVITRSCGSVWALAAARGKEGR